MNDKITAKEVEDFCAYLRNCTDAQVQGVYDKEDKAGRRVYANLAMNELLHRQYGVKR